MSSQIIITSYEGKFWFWNFCRFVWYNPFTTRFLTISQRMTRWNYLCFLLICVVDAFEPRSLYHCCWRSWIAVISDDILFLVFLLDLKVLYWWWWGCEFVIWVYFMYKKLPLWISYNLCTGNNTSTKNEEEEEIQLNENRLAKDKNLSDMDVSLSFNQ